MMTRTAVPDRGAEGIVRLYGRAALAAKSRESAFLDGREEGRLSKSAAGPSALAAQDLLQNADS